MAGPTRDQQILAAIEQVLQKHQAEPRRAISHVRGIILSERLDLLTQHLLRTHGPVVQTGPFAGMKYLPQSAGSMLLPKLLGCYEAELHGVVRDIVAKSYDAIVDIGCGEGYYAVGFARLMPAVRIHAFDLDATAQELCRQLARLNGVADRVHVAGECHFTELQDLARPSALIFCDGEGCELTLLDPQAVPGLAHCDLLVEMHDFLNKDTSRLLVARFEPTHAVTFIPNGGRDPYTLAALRELRQLDQFLAIWEGRPGPTPWAFMTARS